ncbi:hypothetical protein [Candidatus Anaplasma sp. TIGMIC]|uniref:hypothetical protein n=1 Tax=Candidatus Anaplasma sp. TIGMIC TaxID=3020713 RepID=UPI00232DECDD|nr:hypothetical protein [Candidatus Anaplasma sp. TIGMIC]MDB1135428.1 hypothetical protein [Candidatus Anaplasma sp. TIGMIC]
MTEEKEKLVGGTASRGVVDISSRIRRKVINREKGILPLSFRDALTESFNGVDSATGEQFVKDAGRCTWNIDDSTYTPTQINDILGAWQQVSTEDNVDLAVKNDMQYVTDSNYRVSPATFSKKFHDRCSAILTLNSLLGTEEILLPTKLRLLDEVVSHCHQSGLTSFMYFSAVLPIREAMEKGFAAMRKSKTDPEQESICVNADQIKRHVEATNDGGIRITEDVDYTFRSTDCDAEESDLLKAQVTLRYSMHEAMGGVISYNDCSASIKAVPLCGLHIETQPTGILAQIQDIIIRALEWCIKKIKDVFGSEEYKAEQQELPVLEEIRRYEDKDHGESVELQYRIPGALVNPYELRKGNLIDEGLVEEQQKDKFTRKRRFAPLERFTSYAAPPSTLEETELLLAEYQGIDDKRSIGRS